MPQVAQQDYIKIAPKIGRALTDDAAALAQLAGHLKRGTLLDVLLSDYPENGSLTRVAFFVTDTRQIGFIDSDDFSVSGIAVDFSEKQYEGLSAIQLAEDEREGATIPSFPSLTVDENDFLMDDEQGVLICVDDYKLIATDNEGNLASLSISQDKVDPDNDDFVNITWEDAQKLIGLPISS